MKIYASDFKKGTVEFEITTLDDLWQLSQIIEEQDTLKATAHRKVKIGDSENAKVTRKTATVTLRVEKLEYQAENEVLRVNGTIEQGPVDFPSGSYQSISLNLQSQATLHKTTWPRYIQEKLKQASQDHAKFIYCLFDRDEALFAISTSTGEKALLRLKSDLPKKQDLEASTKSTFYNTIISQLEDYAKRYQANKIIVASPAFYKEELLKLMSSEDLKQKTISSSCSSVTMSALTELRSRPELKKALQGSILHKEQMLLSQLLERMGSDGAYSYGFTAVSQAVEQGAVDSVLITDGFIGKFRKEKDPKVLDALLNLVEQLSGEVHILSSNQDPGKRLDGLSGIAALLRYKIE